jgi:predicted amidohydrolase
VTILSSMLRVAAAQYPLDEVRSLDAWAAKVTRWVHDGAETGARLLVFPEYGAMELAATGGPAASSDLVASLASAADRMAEAGRVWSRLAAGHDVYILAPSGPEHRGGGFVNAARLYGPGGGVGVQEKLILTPFERDWGMSAGRSQTVFDTALGRIGVAICYDAEFPLLVRNLTEAGAEILLVPSCTEHLSGFNRVRNGAMARALESQIVAITSPTVGEAAWSPAVDRNTGSAGVFVPPDAALSMSGVLAEGSIDAPGWVVGEVDLARLQHLRDSGEMRNWSDWCFQPGATPLGGGVALLAVR